MRHRGYIDSNILLRCIAVYMGRSKGSYSTVSSSVTRRKPSEVDAGQPL